MVAACASAPAWCQTPSPLQEWQYTGGITLYRMYEPVVPPWRVVLGAAEVLKPLYDGAQPYRVETGPVIDIRYSDIAFASAGEGLGVNIVRSDKYTAGIAVGYDLGRHMTDYSSHLAGLGDIASAPVIKLFESYVISKTFPLVLRADVRQFVGGAEGIIGDVAVFMPLPGSSKTFAMFAGPSLTLADGRYMQKEFGVSPVQGAASGYRIYGAHGGLNAAGFGFSATQFITPRWLINADLAVDRLLGSAGSSPITQLPLQGVIVVSVAYSR
jgi:outer membrane scaffolding protein for murein synthesis (MipA/OmpV family)